MNCASAKSPLGLLKVLLTVSPLSSCSTDEINNKSQGSAGNHRPALLLWKWRRETSVRAGGLSGSGNHSGILSGDASDIPHILVRRKYSHICEYQPSREQLVNEYSENIYLPQVPWISDSKSRGEEGGWRWRVYFTIQYKIILHILECFTLFVGVI